MLFPFKKDLSFSLKRGWTRPCAAPEASSVGQMTVHAAQMLKYSSAVLCLFALC
jgi:hypothetical protein